MSMQTCVGLEPHDLQSAEADMKLQDFRVKLNFRGGESSIPVGKN